MPFQCVFVVSLRNRERRSGLSSRRRLAHETSSHFVHGHSYRFREKASSWKEDLKLERKAASPDPTILQVVMLEPELRNFTSNMRRSNCLEKARLPDLRSKETTIIHSLEVKGKFTGSNWPRHCVFFILPVHHQIAEDRIA